MDTEKHGWENFFYCYNQNSICIGSLDRGVVGSYFLNYLTAQPPNELTDYISVGSVFKNKGL